MKINIKTKLAFTLGCLACVIILIKINGTSSKETVDEENAITEKVDTKDLKSKPILISENDADSLRHLLAACLYCDHLDMVDSILKSNMRSLSLISDEGRKRDLIIKMSTILKPFKEIKEINGMDDPVRLAISLSKNNEEDQKPIDHFKLIKAETLLLKTESLKKKSIAAQHLGMSMIYNNMASEGKNLMEQSLLHTSKVEDYKEKLELLDQISNSISTFGESHPLSALNLQIQFIKEQSKPAIHPAVVLVEKINDPLEKINALSNFAASLANAGDSELASSTLQKIITIIESIKEIDTQVNALTLLSIAQLKCNLPKESEVTLNKAISSLEKIESTGDKTTALGKIIETIHLTEKDTTKSLVLDHAIKLTNEIQQKSNLILKDSLSLASTLDDKEKRLSTINAISMAFENSKSKTDLANQNFKLGSQYHNGVEFPKNITLATEWYKKASLLGHAKAQLCLALILIKDPQSQSEAISWLNKCANQGDPEGQASLGMLYALGKGVEVDLVAAHKWITLAADQGNEQAVQALSQLSNKLSEDQKVASSELIKEWKGKNTPEAKKAASKETPKPSDAKA